MASNCLIVYPLRELGIMSEKNYIVEQENVLTLTLTLTTINLELECCANLKLMANIDGYPM